MAEDAVALEATALRVHAVAEVGLRVGEQRDDDKVPVGRDPEEPLDPLKGGLALDGTPEPGVRRIVEHPMGGEESVGTAVDREAPRRVDEAPHVRGK